ncbi:MAG: AmmeMemoRadiSam system protein B [Treponema sp.]|nr:AmmeMemoRadiSam system protein B [Treponema sp.]
MLLICVFFFAGCRKENTNCWGGIVSHHDLAGKYIDGFFEELSKTRDVETFVIICPSHFGLSTKDWSVADYVWKLDNKKCVSSNKQKSETVRKNLGVEYDNQVFVIEHGASTLMPYINKYFPKADAVVVAVQGEPPLVQPDAQKLYEAVMPLFADKKGKKNFLLISSDFAHHGNIEQTKEKDERSEQFFKNPVKENYFVLGCDNRPGMFVMSRFCNENTKVRILSHTNSYEISGVDEDITSYFFVLMENTKKD